TKVDIALGGFVCLLSTTSVILAWIQNTPDNLCLWNIQLGNTTLPIPINNKLICLSSQSIRISLYFRTITSKSLHDNDRTPNCARLLIVLMDNDRDHDAHILDIRIVGIFN